MKEIILSKFTKEDLILAKKITPWNNICISCKLKVYENQSYEDKYHYNYVCLKCYDLLSNSKSECLEKGIKIFWHNDCLQKINAEIKCNNNGYFNGYCYFHK